MASRWFYKLGDQQWGPVAFHDLAALVRTGRLTEKDRVRRDVSQEWTAASEVIGLFRAAEVERGEEETAESAAAPPSSKAAAPPAAVRGPSPTSPRRAESGAPPAAPAARDTNNIGGQTSGATVPKAPPRRWKRPGRRALFWLAAGTALGAASIIGHAVWSHRQSRIFPESALKRPRQVEKTLLESLRAARPKVPSVPDLEEGVPRPIPGLEQIEPAYTPCLTRDLKTIVFAWYHDGRTGYDLYLATRGDVAQPFGRPALIKSTVSPKTEAYASLSADGLELVFLRGDGPKQMFRCMRETATSDFGEPVLVATPGWDAPKRHIEATQFIDSRHLVFCGTDYAANVRSLFVLERTDPKGPFGLPKQMKLPAPLPPPYFFSDNGLRGYFDVPQGLYVSFRNTREEMPGDATLVLNAEKSGPFQGPIWLTAEEDVLFYCSPGPGKEVDSARKLWMIRF
jgi:hypothetical protein